MSNIVCIILTLVLTIFMFYGAIVIGFMQLGVEPLDIQLHNMEEQLRGLSN